MSIKKVCCVIGVGKGIGFGVAEKFAKEGFSVALVSRNKEKLEPFVQNIQKKFGDTGSFAVEMDATNAESVEKGFKEIRSKINGRPIDVLIYNASAPFKVVSVEKTDVNDFQNAWKASCLGAFLTSQQVLSEMYGQQNGTIIFTGATASLRGGASFGLFASSKFALRGFAQSLARESYPKGVHVSHVIIDGYVDINRDYSSRPKENWIDPDAIASTYFSLYSQDKSAWTHEIDIRPHTEKW
ncbi:hypothetical protein ACTFIW_001733 [Dictyostelium discoideum]